MISLCVTTISLEQCAVLRLSSRKTINSKSGHLESKFSPCLPPCANNMAKTDRGEIKCDQSQHHSNHEISVLYLWKNSLPRKMKHWVPTVAKTTEMSGEQICSDYLQYWDKCGPICVVVHFAHV